MYGYDLSGHLLEESAGSAITDYIYLDGRPVAALTPAKGTLAFLSDDRPGTPQLASNSAQAIVWKATYQPFGSANVSAASVTQNLRLPGQYFDAESGLHQNGFRDYSPALGRYAESDPIGLGGGMNTYRYARSNPFSKADPTGTCIEDACIGEIILAIEAIEAGGGISVLSEAIASRIADSVLYAEISFFNSTFAEAAGTSLATRAAVAIPMGYLLGSLDADTSVIDTLPPPLNDLEALAEIGVLTNDLVERLTDFVLASQTSMQGMNNNSCPTH